MDHAAQLMVPALAPVTGPLAPIASVRSSGLMVPLELDRRTNMSVRASAISVRLAVVLLARPDA